MIAQGDLHDHESLVKAIKPVDVVISAVGRTEVEDQFKLIAAIKEVGNIKVRWLTYNLIQVKLILSYVVLMFI